VGVRLEGHIDLPEHVAAGGFDHASVDHRRRRLYVAHTANDAIDVVDLDRSRYVRSIGGLTGVAGALVDESAGFVFTSNRGEDTVGILGPDDPDGPAKVAVGRRPNGLAFDPGRRTLLAANVGDPQDPSTHTVSIIDTERAVMTASIPVAGRTRWAVFDAATERFFVNVADPPSIVVIDSADPTRIATSIPIPAAGPHGLDIDEAGRLYCACDAGRLLVLAPPSYSVVGDLALAGAPDVIFLDRGMRLLYVAIGDPGLIEVFDIDRLVQDGSVETEKGAHTIAVDFDRHRVYAFLPETHRAAVFAAT